MGDDDDKDDVDHKVMGNDGPWRGWAMMTMDDDNAFSFCTLKLVDVTTQGPPGGTSQGVSLLSGSFSAMKSPVGFHGVKEPATVIHSSTRGQPA